MFIYTTLISSIFTPRSRKMRACRTSSNAVLLQGFGLEVVKQRGVWSNHATATAPRCLHKALCRCCGDGRGLFSYFIPRSLPSFLCRPALVVGIPVAFEIFLFIFVIPSARFQLKDRPGILLFAIWRTTFWLYIFDCTKCNNRHIVK
nr:MAG TPA: hypothetical protein [Caudoviricetes sp.]